MSTLPRQFMLKSVSPAYGPAARGRFVLVDGEFRLRHTETFEAAAVWIVNHNMGFEPPAVTVRTLGGVALDAHVQHVSQNQLRVYFDVPVSGIIDLA